MSDPIDIDQLELLARAIFGALAPITGVRATGLVTATALPGSVDAQLPKNTYLRPVVRGELREDLLFKTTEAWTQTPGTSEAGLPITSQLGGSRHNLPAGTVLRFDPVPPGFAPTVTLDAPMTDGSNAGAHLLSTAFFEDLDSTNPEADIFAALLTVPALLLVWTRDEPMDGIAGGAGQGDTRRRRGVKSYRSNFIAYIVVGRLQGDTGRRREGILLMQMVSRLLTDRMQNDDGEQLSTFGSGVEITGRSRYRRDAKTYIYAVTFRVNQTLEKAPDTRAFADWDRTHTRGALPGREAPEPTTPIDIVDALDDMP